MRYAAGGRSRGLGDGLGGVAASDFTSMNSLNITIVRQPYEHLCYHFVLTYSNWESVTLAASESFEALSDGLQNALWELGGVPRRHRSDSLSAAVNNLSVTREFQTRYRDLSAAERGVKLTVIVETPDKIEGEGEYCTIEALGLEVAACSSVYFWPKENRPLSESKKVGILHVKCAVADGERLFLSSANLTQQAFTINMELGMLVRGGTMPRRVEEQFERLISEGHLRQI